MNDLPVEPLPRDLPAALVRTAVDNTMREFPHQLLQVLSSADDVLRPRRLHPAFYGGFDWHSAVHNHWLLAYALWRWPEEAEAAGAESVLDTHLTSDAIATEAAFFTRPHQATIERPYGWVWVVRLDAELARCPHEHASTWRAALAALVEPLRRGLWDYLEHLETPIDSGMHANTAYTLMLFLDSALVSGDTDAVRRVRDVAMRWYGDVEPGRVGPPRPVDFLDPRLAAVDLMSLVLSSDEFAAWLGGAVPDLAEIVSDDGGAIADSDDPLVVHQVGLPLARAWAIESAARALGPDNALAPTLGEAAVRDAHEGFAHAVSDDFLSDHWVPSFAAYVDARRVLATDLAERGAQDRAGRQDEPR